MAKDPLAALARPYRVPPGGDGWTLDDVDPDDKRAFPDRAAAEAGLADDIAAIDRLQEVLYAQQRHAVLVVLQAMDTGGKDSTVRSVFGVIDPLGVRCTSFKKPTSEELARDFLWRVHAHVPPRGIIGIFNRSHYEDVLVARVHALAPKAELEARYEQINAFERHLAANGTTILKFFLHISKKEQAERLGDRLKDPTKHWKFNPGDLDERKRWRDYMKAYELAVTRCSTDAAPWWVVPADRKWYRNAVIARIVRATLEGLDLRYPPAPEGIERFRIV
ncbi:MAG TPA: polyphosphate kinase 2 family protein [Planctomycetota bacterium]|nr:polyphosphate kinase 2 family protein [Planctomycetota bacterium]